MECLQVTMSRAKWRKMAWQIAHVGAKLDCGVHPDIIPTNTEVFLWAAWYSDGALAAFFRAVGSEIASVYINDVESQWTDEDMLTLKMPLATEEVGRRFPNQRLRLVLASMHLSGPTH